MINQHFSKLHYLPSWPSIKSAICLAILTLLLAGCGAESDSRFGGESSDTVIPSGGSPIADNSGSGSDTTDSEDLNNNVPDEGNDTNSNEDDEANNEDETPDGESITLNWTEPSLFEDGEALSRSEIDSYEIFWGLNETDLTTLTVINDPNTLEFIVNGLFQGVYYFSISVTTIYGNTSDQSNVIKKVII
ncbi:MAG: fibronectin type III domain-containing protein [Pseudomonadales bacterium]|nr:fibronectin type III domain-containing protein [Pseudomonadales bacterium]